MGLNIKVNIDTSNVAKFFNMGKRKAKRLVRQEVRRAAIDIEQRAKMSIAGSPKNYRTYSYKGRITRSSSPGGPPADQSGTLRNSITKRFKRGGMVADIGPQAHYGGYLEKGTSKMAARPFMLPALEIEREQFLRRVRFAIMRGFE